MAKMTKKRNLNRKQQNRLQYSAAFILPFLYYAAVLILEHFAINSAGWKFIAGLVVVIAADAFIYALYSPRLWVKKTTIEQDGSKESRWINITWRIISMSNLFALVPATVLFSLCYLALPVNANSELVGIINAMSFESGKFITDSLYLLLNVPFMNLGLAAVVLCMILLGVLQNMGGLSD
ncbi:MAG: hypothetical protein IJS28_04700 [Synergistaceae bacterium]|nr:hypothetical protein [Synergistaceae bacterium]